MKRAWIVVGSLVLIAALAYPVFAWGPGGGRGYHGKGFRGGGPGYCLRDGGVRGDLTLEQQVELDKLDQKYYNETNSLRNKIWTKKREFDVLLSEKDVDEAKVTALHKEITDLKAQMAGKRFQYRMEARKIAPDAYPRQAWGGRGQGKFHKGFRARGGYGHGGCWN